MRAPIAVTSSPAWVAWSNASAACSRIQLIIGIRACPNTIRGILRVADRSGQLQLHNPVENFDRFVLVEFHNINLRQLDGVIIGLCRQACPLWGLLSPKHLQAQVNHGAGAAS